VSATPLFFRYNSAFWPIQRGSALVALLGDRVFGVPDHHQRGELGERIHDRGFGSGIRSISLSWIAAQPRMLDPSMPKPSSKLLSSSSPIGMKRDAASPECR